MNNSGVRVRALLCVVLLAVITVVSALPFNITYAAQITTRSLTLKQHTGVVTGGSAASGIADHAFAFTIPSSTSIGAIGFQYCTTADPGTACVTPTGLTTTSATVTGLSANVSGWTLTNTTNGAPFIKNGSLTSVTGATTVTLANITNPSTANTTFFVRIATYTTTSPTVGTTTANDAGTVAASTTNTILVSGYMPEFLQFCTGDVVTVNCASATNNTVYFNKDFDTLLPSAATSMMAAATNASSGYSIVATGTTLTSGTNTIPQIGTTAVQSNTTNGTSEFGINLVQNTTLTSTPAKGAPIAPASSGSTLQANPTSAYATPDKFALDLSGATAIANSDAQTPGTSKPTNSQVYTVTYMVNVSGVQAPGTYVATLNYVCTPNF